MTDKKVHVSPKLSGFKEQQCSNSYDSPGLVWAYSCDYSQLMALLDWLTRVASLTWVGPQLGGLEWIARWLSLSLYMAFHPRLLHSRAEVFQDGGSKNFGCLQAPQSHATCYWSKQVMSWGQPRESEERDSTSKWEELEIICDHLKSTRTSKQESLLSSFSSLCNFFVVSVVLDFIQMKAILSDVLKPIGRVKLPMNHWERTIMKWSSCFLTDSTGKSAS